MFVIAMTSNEIYTEAMKDFMGLQTKIKIFIDRCNKHCKAENFHGKFLKRTVIKTAKNNLWTITVFVKQNCYAVLIYAPIIGQKSDGYVALSNYDAPMVLEYTSHFILRYKERCLSFYNIDIGNFNAIEYFMLHNMNSIYVRQPDNSYYIISEQGIMIGSRISENMINHKTFIGNDNLTLRKKVIVDEQYQVLCASNALLRLPDNLNIDVVKFVAARFDLSDTFVVDWYKWHGISYTVD